jgi:hypothetical protein
LPTDDPGAPAAWLPASRTYLPALFTFENAFHGETYYKTGFPARRNTLPVAARFCRMESSWLEIIRGVSELEFEDSGK